MLVNAPNFRVFFGMVPEHALWFAIQPLSAGVFGVPLGFAVAITTSLLTRRKPVVVNIV
jgi:cation/acetate symporter